MPKDCWSKCDYVKNEDALLPLEEVVFVLTKFSYGLGRALTLIKGKDCIDGTW